MAAKQRGTRDELHVGRMALALGQVARRRLRVASGGAPSMAPGCRCEDVLVVASTRSGPKVTVL